MKNLVVFIFIFFGAGLLLPAAAQDITPLPPPQKTGGMPLMEVLAKRRTVRSFKRRDLSQQQISDLLWAAFGINRPDGKRTAPSARNFQENDLYLLMKNGVYLYLPETHSLEKLMDEDIRHLGGTQDFVKDAPLTLVLIADLDRMGGAGTGTNLQTAYIDAGYISQNIYLFCTSAGLSTGARGLIDREALGAALKLKDSQAIIIAHCVGYEK
ncbi:MAG TPA: SagB/ThcOx family dehydrogenase [Bacteroidetes bacterium]|nr:SagB/ThcOx family dehydrogenase [Bacteroidota bacterium]